MTWATDHIKIGLKSYLFLEFINQIKNFIQGETMSKLIIFKAAPESMHAVPSLFTNMTEKDVSIIKPECFNQVMHILAMLDIDLTDFKVHSEKGKVSVTDIVSNTLIVNDSIKNITFEGDVDVAYNTFKATSVEIKKSSEREETEAAYEDDFRLLNDKNSTNEYIENIDEPTKENFE